MEKSAINKLLEYWDNKDWVNNFQKECFNLIEMARRLAKEEEARIHLDDVNREAAMRPLIEENRRLKAQVFAQEDKAEAPIGDEAQKRYYNECAKNSVLYDLASSLITRLEYHDPNDPILEKAEEQLNGNGYSLGVPAEKPTAPASLVDGVWDVLKKDDVGCENELRELIIDVLSRYRPTPEADILGEGIELMKCARNHGGPTAYHDAEDSVGYYVCCGKVSCEDHEKDCWYRKMCEFLDRVEGGVK